MQFLSNLVVKIKNVLITANVGQRIRPSQADSAKTGVCAL